MNDVNRDGTSVVGFSTECVLALAFVIFASAPLLGQQCPEATKDGPSTASEVRTLEGALVFHDSIRKWFELKLDSPQCGQDSIELVRASLDDWRPLEILRGCRVKSTGTVDISSTGYYSLATYQDVTNIEPIGSCETQLPLPDYSDAKPDHTVRRYRVNMHVNYEPGDHPIIFHVSSAGKELQPWQAYASYSLTGGYVLYGYCADGFVVDKVFGTPQAKPTLIDTASFDPESAAVSGKTDLLLGYTCIRQP